MSEQESAAPQAQPRIDERVKTAATYKNPWLAGLLSGMPGAGNLYNGLYLRGVLFFLIIVTLIALANRGYPILGFAIAFFWLFNMIDAYRQATLINYGYAQDLGVTDLPKMPKAGQGGVVAGVVLFVLGLFAMLERYFPGFDIEWLFDLWPFALMAIGAWVAIASWREREKRKAEQTAAELEI